MVTGTRGLTVSQLEALAALESRVVSADGGRLKLEWDVLRGRSSEQIRDFLYWSPDRSQLLGFAGSYVFGQSTPELAGMVDPEYRRQGIGTALLDAAAAESGRQGHRRVLVVTPRNGAGGSEFVARHGGRLEHSEHAMLLRGEPTAGNARPDVTLRVATGADIPRIAELLEEGFGHAVVVSDIRLDTEHQRQLVAEQEDEVVGCLNVKLAAGRGSIYGFVVAADRRGQGIGRDVLRRACLDLRHHGAGQVDLEVATDNDNALGLYQSLGFERVITEDYFELKV